METKENKKTINNEEQKPNVQSMTKRDHILATSKNCCGTTVVEPFNERGIMTDPVRLESLSNNIENIRILMYNIRICHYWTSLLYPTKRAHRGGGLGGVRAGCAETQGFQHILGEAKTNERQTAVIDRGSLIFLYIRDQMQYSRWGWGWGWGGTDSCTPSDSTVIPATSNVPRVPDDLVRITDHAFFSCVSEIFDVVQNVVSYQPAATRKQ